MKSHKLLSQQQVIAPLSSLFSQIGDSADSDGLRLQVREDKCFADKWLDIGAVNLRQRAPNTSDQDEKDACLSEALNYGAYEWEVPGFAELIRDAVGHLQPSVPPASAESGKPVRTGDQKSTDEDKVRRALECVRDVMTRCGLLHPLFDAGAMVDMPLRRPTTILTDVNGILQGSLDFVVRFLYPAARIKVPAIVNMEILLETDRYFSRRRDLAKKTADKINLGQRAKLLLDHVTSQGGQRVLLRLELHSDAEIERPRLGADPLRGIVQPDSDPEDANLGLQRIVRSFADRLILETVIQHRDRLNPDHPVQLLTADQGLARMAMTEGVQPLFFSVLEATAWSKRTVQGTVFHPLSCAGRSGRDRLYFVPLPALLWELAATFGFARLWCKHSGAMVELGALGEGLTWQPYHAEDDLLWVRTEGLVERAKLRQVSFVHPAGRGEQPQVRSEDLAGQGDPRQIPSVHPSGRGEQPQVRSEDLAGRGEQPQVRSEDLAGQGDPRQIPSVYLSGRGEQPQVRSEDLAGRGEQPQVRSEDLVGRGDPRQASSARPPRSSERQKVRSEDLVGQGDQQQSSTPSSSTPHTTETAATARMGSYHFSPHTMVQFVTGLANRRKLTEAEGQRLIGIHSSAYREYVNFLLAGEFAREEQRRLLATEALDELVDSLRGRDIDRIRDLLSKVYSFRLFVKELEKRNHVSKEPIVGVRKAAYSTYCALAEICAAAVRIGRDGMRATPVHPKLEDFVAIAISVYQKLRRETGSEYILSGAWLEALAEVHGIHPLTSRQLLAAAQKSQMLQRYTEGAAPERAYEEHFMYTLDVREGQPVIEPLRLYHGTFLLPERASVSLRLVAGPGEGLESASPAQNKEGIAP